MGDKFKIGMPLKFWVAALVHHFKEYLSGKIIYF